MDGDFSWLWRREELSDFTLVIRPVLPKQPAADAEQPEQPDTSAPTEGIKTRSSKRRRAASNEAGAAAGAAEASAADVPAGQRHRRHYSRRRQPDQGAEAAVGNNRAATQQQHEQGHGQQQQPLQPANARLTRRQQPQQQQQQGQQQQLPQQQPAQGLIEHQQHQHDLQAAVAAHVRRSRRHSGQSAQDSDVRDQQAAAAVGAADQQQQQPQQHRGHQQLGSAANSPGGRVTRASSRKKQRGSGIAAGTAAAAAAIGEAAGSSRTAAAAAAQQQETAGQQSRVGTLRSQQQQNNVGTSAAAATGAADGAGSSAVAPPAAAAAASIQQPQQHLPEIRLPVHAVVLAGFSEYFKALICSWSGNINRMITLDVGVDEGHAAELMVEFMYTGKLPSDAPADELLRMIRLADQYQVTRFLAAASTSFEALPLSSLSLSLVLELFSLPQVMLDAPEMGRVVAKARAKLLELYGDLEKVWSSEQLREQFVSLPLPAVRCLLASEQTAVAAENTALVALAGWVEEGPAGRAATPAQRKELLSLIRLPYLTSSFIGDILHSVPWIRDALDSRQLLNAFQFAAASESTRQRLASYESGPSALTPHFRCPRPLSSVTRASFEWAIELSTIKRMVADAKLWGRVVELSSPLHYYAGFWWQLLFNVEKTPTPPDAAPDVAAAAAATVVEFVGVRCHVNCGAHDYWPRVVRFKASIAALQTGFWEMDYAYMKGIEGPIVDGVGLGYPGFFSLPGQALENEAAWSRFVRQGRVQLRCEVLDCE